MDNIDFVLENLESPPVENDFNVIDDLLQSLNTPQTEIIEKSTKIDHKQSPIDEDPIVPKKLFNRTDEKEYSFDDLKKNTSSKYNDYGSVIHKYLKENRQSQFDSPVSSWNVNTKPKEKSTVLSVTTSPVKNDVYAEPIFGLRLM